MSAPALLCLVVALSLTGCVTRTSHSYSQNSATSGTSYVGSGERLMFRYNTEGNRAALESENLRLIFTGISEGQRKAFAFKDGQVPVQVSGDGTSTVTVSCRHNLHLLRFQSTYVSGTNTVQFGERSVRFCNGGKLLLIDDQSIDLTDGHKTICLTRKGAVVE